MPPMPRTLLIVDDSLEDRELYRRYLLRDREYAYTFIEATLGQQGLELWQQHQPDAVLLDYRLPDLDGLEFLSKLQPFIQEGCLPAVVITGQGNEAIAVQAMKTGAQDYLVKEQLTPEGLHLAVSGAIETVRLRTQLRQRIEREQVVTQLTRQIHQSLRLDDILQTTVTEVRQFLHTDRVVVFQLHADGNGTVVAESVGSEWRSLLSSTLYDPCLAEHHLRFSRPESLTHDPAFAEAYFQRYREGQVTAIANIRDGNLEPCHAELLASFQVQANLVVPIVHDDQFWGLLIAHHCAAPRSWQPLEIDLLKELATQVSIALRQAELYQQAQAELAERRQAEAALRESEERFRQLAENIDAVFWLREEPEGKVSYISPAYERLWGVPPQALYDNPQSWIDRIHPDDREWTVNAFQTKAAAGQFDEEYRIVLADGSIRWVHDRCFPLRNAAGELYRFAGIAEDVTDRKRSETALQRSEERFRTSVENMLDCFGIYRTMRNEQGAIVDFEIEYVNDAACLSNLMTREQQVGQGLCTLLPGHRDMGLFDEYCQVVETGRSLVKDSLIYEDDYGQQRLVRAFDIHVAKLGDGFIATWRDITARKQTEETLRHNEQLLRLALAGAQAGTWAWELATGKLTWSSETYHLHGLDPANGLPEYDGWYDTHLHPDDRAWVNAAVARVLEQRLPEIQLEFRIIHPQRGVRWLLSVGRLTASEWDHSLRLSGINLDITNRKLVEEALRQSEEFKRRMLDSSSDCIKLLDLNGQLLYMNTGGLCLMEIDDFTPYVNADWASLWCEDDRHAIDDAIAAAKSGGQGRFQGFCPTAKGTPKWWDVIVTPIFDTADFDTAEQVVQILATARDITDRRHAEAALRQSEERYRTLFESMEDGFCVIEMVFDEANTPIDYRFLETNPAFTHQTGLEQAEGQTARQLIPGLEDHWFETYGRVALTGEPVRFENGSDVMSRWFDVYAFRVEQPEKRKVAILFKDISESKRAEQEREQLLAQEQVARAAAERANRIKDEFLAVLSHELRSPLNPILGWTKLLQTRSFDDTQTAQALATIERNAKLQTQLIDDLLDMAKILGGKLSVGSEPVNLTVVIEAAIDTVKTAAVAKNILLHPILPNIGQVSGDATRLQQVVWNLLSNAIKFTPKGGQVELWLERAHDQAQITVSDTGKGINPNFLPYIFESFLQEDVSITRKYGGLGLGLAIVRQLVEAHGGTIAAASPGDGLGATFTVRLPLLKLASPMQETETRSQPAFDLTGIRILTVDDDPDARELLTVLLTQYGASVLTVVSAAEVLAALITFHPDVLISDIGMPEVDGYTLIQQIRRLPPQQGGQTPAIALTAYAREDDSRRALASGFQRHVTKPLDPEQLVQAVMALAHKTQ